MLLVHLLVRLNLIGNFSVLDSILIGRNVVEWPEMNSRASIYENS